MEKRVVPKNAAGKAVGGIKGRRNGERKNCVDRDGSKPAYERRGMGKRTCIGKRRGG